MEKGHFPPVSQSYKTSEASLTNNTSHPISTYRDRLYGVRICAPVCRDYGEGTFPPCISIVQDKQSESDEQCESSHAYVT
eukprot:6626340-Ditylum_brightwellii.AAC.1